MNRLASAERATMGASILESCLTNVVGMQKKLAELLLLQNLSTGPAFYTPRRLFRLRRRQWLLTSPHPHQNISVPILYCACKRRAHDGPRSARC